MPTPSNTRKTSTATMTVTEAHPFMHSTMSGAHVTSAAAAAAAAGSSSSTAPPRRSTSGRAIRVNTTRPANYYARPFGPVSASAGGSNDMHAPDSAGSSLAHPYLQHPIGFFPALQYFSDAIAALPKEVMRQFTLMKEVEAKIHGPGEKLDELLDRLIEAPVPSREEAAVAAALRGELPAAAAAATIAGASSATGTHGLVVGSTAANSASGSASASLVNGMPGGHGGDPRASMPLSSTSAAASVHSEDGGATATTSKTTDEERARRARFHELRMLTHGLFANLDEKNVVLAEANRVLGLQERRIDSVMPHVEGEIHEEARLGSMTHWAYSDNRQKKQAAGTAGAASRRDVAATNSLAAAASAVHEHDIAQARRDAGREATREKTKGKRALEQQQQHPGDSDFDEKPKRGPKGTKGKAATQASSSAAAAVAGLGISANGEPVPKRKKTEKAAAAVGMERTVSATGRTLKAAKDTPRSTPAAEPSVKKAPKAKPAPPPPKKKPPPSTQASPMLASSPLVSTFSPAIVEPPPSARPQSARLRQNSNATNPRIEKMAASEEASSRPVSAAGKPSTLSEKTNGRRKIPEPIEVHQDHNSDEHTARQLKEASEQLQREDTEMRDAADSETRPVASRSGSNSQKNSGRASKVGTPRNESFADRDVAMSRTRSTRSRAGTKGEGRDSSSSEPQSAGGQPPIISKHRRIISNSNLVKQLAPFNRSPDLDRHRLRDDMEEDLESLDEKHIIIDQIAVPEDSETTPVPPIPEPDRETRRSSVRRPPARNSISSRWRAPTGPEESSPEAPVPLSSLPFPTQAPEASPLVTTEPSPAPVVEELREEVNEEEEEEEEDDEEGSEHDPDDPNEPKYCYCNRGSYGEMVACDNEACPREWFHLGCTELREAPGEEEKWYCRDCRPKFMRKGRGGRGTLVRA